MLTAPSHTVCINRNPVLVRLHYSKMRRNRTSDYKFVRRRAKKFHGLFYAVNPANGFGEWINLGLYPTQEAAAQAVRDFLKTGRRPSHLLPKYVRKTAEGKYVGVVRLRKNGPLTIATQPFDNPDSAHAAIRQKLCDAFGIDQLPRFFPFG